MTSLLLNTLPGLGCRSSAGNFSSRLGCHVLNRRGGNAAPWATRQQIRFASGEEDNYDDDHYKALGVKKSDPIEKIRKIGAALLFATHSDHNKGIDKTKFMKVNAAFRILGNPEKRAKYDPIWVRKYHVPQVNAAPQQRAPAAARAATFADLLARLREEAKRATKSAEVAEAKKRDEERKARDLANREKQRAEAAKNKEAAKKKEAAEKVRLENQRRASIAAAEAAAKKKEEEDEAARKKPEEAAKYADARKAAANARKEEAARKKAEAAAKVANARKAAAKARAAELERRQKREARRVLLRHVPAWTNAWEVTRALDPLQPGRILDMGVREGTAWVEFCTAEEAQAFHRVVTETEQVIILNKTIKSATIVQGRATPPEGPEFITRCLDIKAPPEFLDGEAEMYPAVRKKLAMKGFTTLPVGLHKRPGTHIGMDYASVALAQSAKATLEKHFPELEVSYAWDHCERGTQSSTEGSNSWFAPVDLIFILFMAVIAIFAEIKKDESSDKEA